MKRSAIASQTLIVDGESVLQVIEGGIDTQTDISTLVNVATLTQTAYSFICEYCLSWTRPNTFDFLLIYVLLY